MDFLSKLFKPTKSGSVPSPGNKTSPHPVKSEHETYVEFAREFVEDLVESLPDSSGKNIEAAKYLGVEHSTSLASIVSSENSFDTTLPDLLQPESVYKKQTDTDTDTSHTTEYESALETDAQDNSSVNDGVISDEVFDCAENIVDQQLKFQLSDRNINTHDTHVVNISDNSDLIKPGDCSKASFTKFEEKSGEESILMPSDVFDDSEISFSDCVKAEDVAGILSKTLLPLDISALCAGIANLDLDKSVKSASVSLKNNVLDTSNNLSLDDPIPHTNSFYDTEDSFASAQVQDDSLIGGDVDTIHLIETDENELSVLIIDKTGEAPTLDALDLNIFQGDAQYSALQFVPEEFVKSFPTTLKPFEGSLQLTNEIASNTDEVKKVTVEAPVVDISLTFEADTNPVDKVNLSCEGIKEPAFENINVTFEADTTSVEVNLSCEGIKEPTFENINVTFEAATETVVEDINLTFEAVKEPIGEVTLPFELVQESAPVKTINEPIVGQLEVVTVEQVQEQTPVCSVQDPIVGQLEEPATAEALTEPVVSQVPEPSVESLEEPIVGQLQEPAPVEPVQEPSLVEAVKKPVVERVKAPSGEEENIPLETVKQSDSVKELKEPVVQVEELGVEKVQEPASVEPVKEPSEQVKAPALAKLLQEPTVNQVKEPVADIKHSTLEDIKTLVQLPSTPNREHNFEILQKQEFEGLVNAINLPVDKFNKTRSVELPVTVNHTKQDKNNSDKTPFQIVKDTASISSIAFALPEQNRDTAHVCEQTNSKNIADSAQVLVQPISLLDFGDLAAEAANISNDFLNASQELNEYLSVGSLAVVSVTKTSTMMDTGSTQQPDENVNSVPLDVKWLAEGQNALLKNRNSGVGSLKSAAVDCSNEDPFKRRSLLQNSPPREIILPNKEDTPIKPTCNMEKGAGESSDAQNNHSEAGPDTAETCNLRGDELFRDSSAFEFLSSLPNSQPIRDYRKESLYVKFDPLVGSAPVAKTDRNIPLPPTFAESVRSGDTTLQAQTIIVSSPRDRVTPTKNPALDLVDRLISLSPSPRKQESPRPIVREEPVVSRPTPEQQEMIEELHLLRELLDRQDKAHQEQLLKHKAELEELENQLNVIKQRNQEADEREQRLNKKIVDKAQGQKQMSMIMEEYEKTISRLIAEKEAEHQAHELEKEAIIKEKDLALGHLTNIEIAFSDVHMKYERSKNVIEGFKKNEEVLQESLLKFEATIRKQEQKYDVLKSHAMQQLESANQELDSFKRTQQAENSKLKAMLKKSELKTSSLEEMLEQKIKENQELASICDDLISKVGN